MFKKFVSLLLCATFLLGGTTTAFADEVEIVDENGYSSSAVVASNLSVSNKIADLPLIGAGGLVVDIPSSLPLEYNRKSFKHVCETTVGVRGELSEFAMVYVSVPQELTYTLQDDDTVTMAAETTFQLNSKTEGYVLATWTSAEAAKGKDDSTLTNTKDLKIVADGLNAVKGDYDAEVTFDITVDYFGVADNVGGTSAINAMKITDSYPRKNFCFANEKAEALNEFIDIDFGKLGIPWEFCKVSELTTKNTTVKYIHLTSSARMYNISISTTLGSAKSWCTGLSALEVIYIPRNITKSKIQTPGYNIRSVYDGTDIIIGNAIVFCKDIDENKQCVYVPNIVYGGTMAEWIALGSLVNTGATDWVFGNAANSVTVHCSDGTLLY